MGDSNMSIGSYPFGECRNLKNIKMSKNIKYIGREAFSNCSSLQNIVIWENVEKLGYRSFANWTESQNIKFKIDNALSSWDSEWNKDCNANIVFAYSGE